MTSAQMSEVSRDASSVPIAVGRRDVGTSCRVALARAYEVHGRLARAAGAAAGRGPLFTSVVSRSWHMQDPDAPTPPRTASPWWVYPAHESLKSGTVCERGDTRWRPPSFHPDNDVEGRAASPAALRRAKCLPTIGEWVIARAS